MKLNVSKYLFVFLVLAVVIVPAAPAYASCGDDAYEDDDTPFDATVILAGESNAQLHNWPFNPLLPGTIYNDVDYVRVDAQAGHTYAVFASPSDYAQIKMTVFLGTQSWAVIDDMLAEEPGDPAVVMWQALRAGTYYVLIRNYSASDPTGCPSGSISLIDLD